MMNIVKMLVIVAICLLPITALAYSMMAAVAAALADQADLVTRSTANLLASLWIAVASILFAAAGICSIIRKRRYGLSGGARPDTGNEGDWTRAVANLVEDILMDVVPLALPMFLSAFLLIIALGGLRSLNESEAISWPVFKMLGYGLVATAWASAIYGSVWMILHPPFETSRIEDENSKAEKL